AARARPGDPLVGGLLGDLRVPLLALAADLGDPVQVGVIELGDRLDGIHELREVLELGPLVVGDLDGDIDLDRTLDSAHGVTSRQVMVGDLSASFCWATTAIPMPRDALRRRDGADSVAPR